MQHLHKGNDSLWRRYAKLVDRAREWSRDGVGQQSIIAVAYRKGRITAIGRNSYTKTHPRQSYLAKLTGMPKREYLHAEISALIRAPRDADTLVVLRFDKEGNPVCAKPCPVCSLAINTFPNVLEVIHT